MGFQDLKTPKVPLPPKLEPASSDLSNKLATIDPEFAAKLRARLGKMGYDLTALPEEAMIKGYKFKNGIYPINGEVSKELMDEIDKRYLKTLSPQRVRTNV